MNTKETICNYIGGAWFTSRTEDVLPVLNPATAAPLGYTPLSPAVEVDQAVQAAAAAFEGWRRTPAPDRIQHLFRLKELLEENFEDLARVITLENGKTIGESRGEFRRAIENVEVACGIPTLMQGQFSEDIARGIDEMMIRQPIGVAAIIAPFNFPGMIPFWFMPYALACGNTVVVKPSERVPLTMWRVFHLIEQAGFPPGVVNLVNGGPEAVNALLDHPQVQAISFVGSTPVARYIYGRAGALGKRVQAQGGAKNPTVILPDADLEMTTRIVADSAFGNAGQRCLATSLVITVGSAREPFTAALAEVAERRAVGHGLQEGVEMGPVITAESVKAYRGFD